MLAAIDFMSEGVTWEELENFYMSEMAERRKRRLYDAGGPTERSLQGRRANYV